RRTPSWQWSVMSSSAACRPQQGPAVIRQLKACKCPREGAAAGSPLSAFGTRSLSHDQHEERVRFPRDRVAEDRAEGSPAQDSGLAGGWGPGYAVAGSGSPRRVDRLCLKRYSDVVDADAGVLLAGVRREAGLTQAELARRAGTSQA